jgi:NAD(P)-dependent dehydrogenase (short-subunit alcohol dehydrogenase family)
VSATAPTGRFAGRVAIATGSSRGIGYAVAARLVSEGASVVVNGRKAPELETAAKELDGGSGRVAALAGNLADERVPRDLAATAIERFGRIDFVVNNVGLSPEYGPLLDAQAASFSKTMVANTWTPVAVVQEAMRVGLDRAGSAVVNISTIASRQVHPFAGVYASSKAALEVLTRVLAREVGTRGVRVNAVAPGMIRTRFTEAIRSDGREDHERRLLPLQRLGEPEDVASAVCFLLSDDAAWITGVTLDVDGGRLLVGDEPYDTIGIFDASG